MLATATICALASSVYLLIAIRCTAYGRRPRGDICAAPRPPVTVLKPLCGLEPRLYECLRSFCAEARGDTQIVFGVRDPADPAIAVVERLISEFPAVDIALVVDRRVHGENLKVSNLINMMEVSRHAAIVVSDADTRIAPGALDRLLAPLAAPDVGAVTCLYKSAAAAGLPSSLAGLFVDSWFLTSATVDACLWSVDYCYGPLSAIRREALDSIGGFAALAAYLADDFMLGQRLAATGWDVVLGDDVVEIAVEEDWRSLLSHELRWARTVRTVRPAQHVLSVVTWSLPLDALALAGPHWMPASAIFVPLVLRFALHALARRRFRLGGRARAWLLPLRELLCFAVWAASFAKREVVWRGRVLSVAKAGAMVSANLPTVRAEAR